MRGKSPKWGVTSQWKDKGISPKNPKIFQNGRSNAFLYIRLPLWVGAHHAKKKESGMGFADLAKSPQARKEASDVAYTVGESVPGLLFSADLLYLCPVALPHKQTFLDETER